MSFLESIAKLAARSHLGTPEQWKARAQAGDRTAREMMYRAMSRDAGHAAGIPIFRNMKVRTRPEGVAKLKRISPEGYVALKDRVKRDAATANAHIDLGAAFKEQAIRASKPATQAPAVPEAAKGAPVNATQAAAPTGAAPVKPGSNKALLIGGGVLTAAALAELARRYFKKRNTDEDDVPEWARIAS